MQTIAVQTPHGPAVAHVQPLDGARGTVVLGHGAGGGVQAPDLQAAARAALAAGFSVTLVEQPYRAAGRRSPAPAAQLDASWIAVLEALRVDVPLVVGGRSSGARVACRTAAATGACGVVCLAFPLAPPGRPGVSRLEELDAVSVPVLVVQGDRDPFGIPPPGPLREVVVVRGDHSLRADPDAVRSKIGAWLTTRISPTGSASSSPASGT